VYLTKLTLVIINRIYILHYKRLSIMNFDDEENARFCGPIIAIGREEVVLNSENSKLTSKGKKSHGFHLMRSKWDPYPWIGAVESESSAELSGLRL
jgi:hypothetical protein